MKRALILAQLILVACVLLIAAGPQNRFVVLIDAGHGGEDSGILSEKGIDEKGLSLDLAQRLGVRLRSEDGIEVRYTRDMDTTLGLKERIALVDQDVDLILSLHADQSPNGETSGMWLYVPSEGVQKDESVRIGEIFGNAVKGLAIPYKGLDGQKFYILHQAPCPALLFSAGYLTNETDFDMLASHTYRDQLATKLADAVRNSAEK